MNSVRYMVVTIVDADVEETNWETLKETYRDETLHIPDVIIQTFLIQSQMKPNSWRIMTAWRSQEDLDYMRKTTPVPLAIRIFKKANAEPILGIWDVLVQNYRMSR